MTAVAAIQGIKNAMICTVPVLAFSGSIYWLLSTFTAASQTTAFFSAFMIPLAVCLLAMLISWIRGIQLRGQLIIDCGTHPGRKLFLFNAVIFLIFGFGGFTFGKLGPIFTTSFAAYWLFMATGRLSVHESGLWIYHVLLPWNKIAEYSWAPDNTLMVKTKGMFSLSRSAVPVPGEHVDDVERLLNQYKTES